MLYLDQPSMVGFSHDVPTNGTLNLPDLHVTPADFSESVPEQNNTFRVGTFAGQVYNTTANSTIHAAHAIGTSPKLGSSSFRTISHMMTESAYGQEAMEAAMDQLLSDSSKNRMKIRNGTISEKGTKYIHLDTLGIINGCIDSLIQIPSWPQMVYNNVSLSTRPNTGSKISRPTESKRSMIACTKPLSMPSIGLADAKIKQ
jgi:hypothetical protein